MADIDFQNGFINGFVAGSTNIEVDMVNRRDTEANWISANPIVANGEQIIVDMPDKSIKIKIGDGVKYFNELEYNDNLVTAGAGCSLIKVSLLMSLPLFCNAVIISSFPCFIRCKFSVIFMCLYCFK